MYLNSTWNNKSTFKFTYLQIVRCFYECGQRGGKGFAENKRDCILSVFVVFCFHPMVGEKEEVATMTSRYSLFFICYYLHVLLKKSLFIDSFFTLSSACNGVLFKSLTLAQFSKISCSFEFLFKAFQRSVQRFVFFYIYNNHK